MLRVWQEDAFAAAVLSSELDQSRLSAADRGLATEITYGVLRTEAYLRARLGRFTKVERAKPAVLVHLLIGAYQLDFLDRIPPHAAVSEAVQEARAEGKHAAGFVNAVLRKVASDPSGRLAREEAIWTSAPAWLRKRLLRDFGEAEARALVVPSDAAALTLRLRPGRALPADLAVSPTWLPGAFRFDAGGDPRRHPAFERGDFVVQELGSQAVAACAGARPNLSVLDACAGRGQKTACLLDAGASVVATDLHEHKLRALETELMRLGLSVETRVHDWTTPPPPELAGRFDVVLLDAPCTGTGTLRRRPEILRRLEPGSAARLSELQRTLVQNAAQALRPGGILVFATCSVLSEEGEDAVRSIPELSAVELNAVALPWVPPQASAGSSTVRLLPSRTGSDGYFVAALARGSICSACPST